MNTIANPDNLTNEDFTEAEHAAVDAMAAPLVAHFKGQQKAKCKFNSRNRSAWNRMNRPSKTTAIDNGAAMINRLVDKGIHLSKPKAV